MAAFSLGPIASGLPKDIVQKLLEIEKRPIKFLEAKKADQQSKLGLVNELTQRVSGVRGEISELSRLRKFRDLMPVVGRPELMDVNVDKTVAEPGDYKMEVLQLAGRSSMMSNAFDNPNDSQIGVGYFSYDLPDGTTKDVFIDEENNTLQGVANKINQQKDLGLHALVVNDGTSDGSEDTAVWRLIISHKESGEVNDAEFPTFYFVGGDDDFYMESEQPAANSIVKVNGQPVEFPGNKITSLLPGVTIDLKEAAPGKVFNLGIKEDIATIKGKILALVDKVNEVLSFIQQQNKLDKDSNTRNTLGGDVTLQNLENRLRVTLLQNIQTSEGKARISDIGIRFTRDGVLSAEEAKIDAALEKNFVKVSEMFAGIDDSGDGFATKLTNVVKGFLEYNGILPTRTDGIKRRIRDIDRQIETKERQLARSEKALKEKFGRLETTMARIKSQGAQISSTLGGSNLLSSFGLGR